MKLSIELVDKLNEDIENMIDRYQDIPVSELAKRLSVNMAAKNSLNDLAKKMIEFSGLKTLSQFDEEGVICLKTIRLEKYGQIKESMSLPVFRYCDIVKETWKTSELRNYFYQKTFAFTVFRTDGAVQYLNKIVVWEMPHKILDEGVRQVWQAMYDLLNSGCIVKYIDDKERYYTYFPSSSENPYVHVRPHARNRQDTFPLPVADKLTGLVQYPKHSFWLNRAYVLKIITKEGNNGFNK